MKEYLKIKIHPVTESEADILVAFLSDIKFYAFEQEAGVLNAFIEKNDFSEDAILSLLPSDVKYNIETIVEENWNEQWEQNFSPVVVDNFVAVRVGFHAPIEGVKHEIVITPKMSFGTGHHATTFMMIELMRSLDFKGKSVIDFGTGTGVLAILAEKSGSSQVVAIDNDDWSISNAKENVAENRCYSIEIKKADNLDNESKADIILANINFNIIKSNAQMLGERTKVAGYLILSGFLEENQTEMEKEFFERNFRLADKRQQGNWVALAFQKI